MGVDKLVELGIIDWIYILSLLSTFGGLFGLVALYKRWGLGPQLQAIGALWLFYTVAVTWPMTYMVNG